MANTNHDKQLPAGTQTLGDSRSWLRMAQLCYANTCSLPGDAAGSRMAEKVFCSHTEGTVEE